MYRGTIGDFVINNGLPEEFRQQGRVLDKKGLDKLLSDIALKAPEQYRDAVQHLSHVGRFAAQMTGGHSFGPEHMRMSVAGRKAQEAIRHGVQAIYANAKLSDEEKEQRVLKLVGDMSDKLTQDVYKESLAEHNPLAFQILSGARGNALNLRSLRSGDLLYVDHRDRPIPFPVTRSYSQGLSPAEFFASTFGARKGILQVKEGVRDAGFFSKQLVQSAHRLLVTALDADRYDPLAAPRGLPSSVEDPNNEGALLAVKTGPYDRNTVLTPKILADLKGRGIENLLVRSPLVGGPPDGGVYGRDVGVREKGGIAPIGDFVGIAAAQALSEPITQSGLSAKHTGGVSGARSMSGFEILNALVQVPKIFKGGAAHAQEDGRVSSIRPAPQGGQYVGINGKDHYVGQGYEITVRPGQEVEAGDAISEGLPNPSEVVKHKGIGEGSRYFVDTFTKQARDAGINVHRRNVELVARGLINHVELDDEWEEHVPGDIVSYRRMEHKYQPREGHEVLPASRAKDRYLEVPVLHYSIGTKIRPSVIHQLAQHGVKHITVHRDPPPFRPLMIRGMENVAHDDDWMTRFLGSYLKKNFLQGVHRGDVSDERGTSYVPSLAQTRDFGQQPPVQGWKPVGPVPQAPQPAPSILKQMHEAEPVEPGSGLERMFLPASQKAAGEIHSAKTTEDPFADFRVEHPAGVTHTIYEPVDDEDPDGYPLREIRYPVNQGRLAGHLGEDGEDLEVHIGTDPKGESGSFTVHRLEPWRTKTKFFHQCSKAEKDQLLRAFKPVLAGWPVGYKNHDEIREALSAFRAK